MPVKFRDYYEILGVTKTATEDELRRAFRRLARQYHPDVAKDKAGAEDKFKEINEAYEVLGDPAKRKKYDQLGADWQRYEQGGAPPPGAEDFFHPRRRGGAGGPRRGNGGPGPGSFEFDFGGSTGFSEFFEQFFGGGAAGGGFPGVDPGTAAGSRGAGDVEADLMITLAEALHGGRRAVSLRRNGAGDGSPQTETYEVKIPAGVRPGQRIRLRGRGQNGGDLYLRVRLARHPDFRVEENGDVFHELPVAAWQAVLGDKVSVPTLEGGSAQLRIPAGSQPGQRFRLRGQGMPQAGGERGDLYVQLEVQLPKTLSPEQRAAWTALRGEAPPET